MALWVCVLSFAIAAIATGLMRHYAVRQNVVDIPNDRSSHTVPTPRGGGVAIVLAFFAGLALFGTMTLLPTRLMVALLGAGALIALVGFADDHRPIAARWRLPVHALASAWGVGWMNGLPPIAVFRQVLDLGIAGDVLAVVSLVWLLNLYNFMDGIDGLAASEAITTCLGAAAMAWVGNAGGSEVLVPLLLAASVLGFLLWNFPPARIFMGDAGSGFLGLTLGILALRSGQSDPALLWSWVILLGVFIVDATVTLVTRTRRRDRIFEAHRSHAYQHAAVEARRHRPVTMAVIAINVVWLLPLAALVASHRLDGALGTLLAFAPLVLLAWRYGAGKPGVP